MKFPRLFRLRTTHGEFVGIRGGLTRIPTAAVRLLREDADAALVAARTRDFASPLRGLSLEELPKRARHKGPNSGVLHLTLAAQAARRRADDVRRQAESYERMAVDYRQAAAKAEHVARIAEGRARAAEDRASELHSSAEEM
jgi:hypothetical protein